MRIREKAKEQAEKNYDAVLNFFLKKQMVHISRSWFGRNFGSSCYMPHQNDGEKSKRLKNYPSLDLARYKR